MKIAIPRTWPAEDKRVAATPETVAAFIRKGLRVGIAAGAGEGAFFSDEAYQQAGAEVTDSLQDLYKDATIVLMIGPPPAEQWELIPPQAYIIGMGLGEGPVQLYHQRRLTVFSLERLPRTSSAQVMDVLSSQNNLLGYWAVVYAASVLPTVFPMLMTSAGRLPSASVLVLGVGVAGLQAIATAKRLGAVVSAFDIRPATEEQAQSLGAHFLRPEPQGTQTLSQTPISQNVLHHPRPRFSAKAIYQRYLALKKVASTDPEPYEAPSPVAELSAEPTLSPEQQKALITGALKKSQVVICSALSAGRKPPVLIDSEMVNHMAPGSLVVDLAADQPGLQHGGNCALSRRGHTLDHQGVRIMAPSYGLNALSQAASHLYANNLYQFVLLAWDEAKHTVRCPQDNELMAATVL